MRDQHLISEENAIQMAEWIQTRGGVQVWSNKPGVQRRDELLCPVTTPAGAVNDEPPHPSSNTLRRTLTKLSEVSVAILREISAWPVKAPHHDPDTPFQIPPDMEKQLQRFCQHWAFSVCRTGNCEWAGYQRDFVAVELPTQAMGMATVDGCPRCRGTFLETVEDAQYEYVPERGAVVVTTPAACVDLDAYLEILEEQSRVVRA